MAYLWGKYERKANYRDEYKERLIKSASYDRDAWEQKGIFNVDGHISKTEYRYCRSYKIQNGRYVGELNYSTLNYSGLCLIFSSMPSDIWSYHASVGELSGKYIIKNATDHYDADRRVYHIMGSLYELTNERVLAGYSQGSYIGEVESSGRHDYPDNGEKGGYFYVYKGLKEVKAPGSIEYERVARGGDTLDIRWTPSDDANVYVLEKGTTLKPVTPTNFKRIYLGRDTSYRDTLEVRNQGEWQVIYRVKAVARDGDESEWTEGSYCFVDINSTPTISGRDEDLGDKNAPFKQSFTVNDSDSGNTLKVTVRLNSAIIQTIENANRNETYTINIDKEKFDELTPNKQNTITVTVDDGQGASANRRWMFTKRNTPPTVSVDQSNLGEQNKPFSFSFTPNDVDGDEITGKVFLDEVQIEDLGTLTREQIKKVTIKKLDYAVLKNGDHRIRIEVTDSKGAKGYGHIDFSKNLTYCWYEFKKDIEGMATSIIVNPSVKLASGAKMTVKVCNNAKDREPAWETIPSEQVGKAYSFKNKNKTAGTWAIGVNIRIDRRQAKEDSYFYGFVGNYQ